MENIEGADGADNLGDGGDPGGVGGRQWRPGLERENLEISSTGISSYLFENFYYVESEEWHSIGTHQSEKETEEEEVCPELTV